MAVADRYTFSIQSKTKYNQNPLNFFVLYFDTEQHATEFAVWMENNILPNYQKLSVSKLVRPAPSAELPVPQSLTDMYTVKILMGNSGSSDKRTNVTIPMKPDVAVDTITAYLTDANHGVIFSDFTPINRVVSYQLVGRNVVAGGPVPA